MIEEGSTPVGGSIEKVGLIGVELVVVGLAGAGFEMVEESTAMSLVEGASVRAPACSPSGSSPISNKSSFILEK